MRIVGWIVAALAGLVLVAVLALVVLLPSWVESAGFREELQTLAQEKLGRSVDYGAVDIRFFPPRVEVADISVGGSDAAAPPAIRAESVALRLAWSSLLRGRAVVDELVIDGANLRMVRTADGIDLLAAAVPASPAAASDDSAAPISLDRVRLRDSTIVFDDRAVTPPVVWQLAELDLEASMRDSDGPIEFELDGKLAGAAGSNGATGQGADVEASGSADLDGPVSVRLSVDALDSGPLRSYVSALSSIGGKVDLTAKVERADGDAPLDADLALTSSQLNLVVSDLAVAGPASVKTTLKVDGETLSGPIQVDLKNAKLDYGDGTIRKPAGMPGSIDGTLSRNAESGIQLDYKLKLNNANASGVIKTEPRLSVGIAAPAFDVTGWGQILPALSDSSPTGTLALENLVFRGSPSHLGGSLKLGGVRIASEGSPPIVLDGFLDARGDALVPRDLSATVGASKFAVAGKISDLFGEGRGRTLALKLVTPQPVESNAVFSLVEAMRDAVHGALALDADVVLPLGGPAAARPAAERLVGDISFQIGGDEKGGKLRGVSLLRSVFERFGALGNAALLAMPAKSGKPIEEYYSENFKIAKATFHVENGEARTKDFEIVHEKYTTRLRGGVRFSDLALDMRGEVIIGEELDAALAGAQTGKVRTIPLARVGGTALKPTVSIDSADVAAFTARYAFGADSKLGKKIDKAIGGGAGDLLRGVLGGARPKASAPAAPSQPARPAPQVTPEATPTPVPVPVPQPAPEAIPIPAPPALPPVPVPQAAQPAPEATPPVETADPVTP